MKQQGRYAENFSIAWMSHDQWRTYFWASCPSWRRPVKRVAWVLSNTALRRKLEAHGVQL